MDEVNPPPQELGLTPKDRGILQKPGTTPSVIPVSEPNTKKQEPPGIYDFINNEVKKNYPDSERLDASGVIGGGYLAAEQKATAVKMMSDELTSAGQNVPSNPFELAMTYDKWTQSKQQLQDEQITPEQEVSSAELAEQVEASRKAVEALVEFALANGAEPSSFDHLQEVWKPEHYNSIPSEEMPPNNAGLTIAETGDVFIRKDRTGNFHTVFHESVHRSAHLRRIRDNASQPAEIVAGLYGFTISPDGKSLEPLDATILDAIPEADREGFLENWRQEVKMATNILVEGITEWAVQKANGLNTADGSVITISKDENTYPLHTDVIDTIHGAPGLEPQKADVLLIETALTGDLSRLAKGTEGSLTIAEVLSEFTPIFIDIKKQV